MFIAADTGHRYANNVYARPQAAGSCEGLAPSVVGSLDQLALPWSVMDWDRRAYHPRIEENAL